MQDSNVQRNSVTLAPGVFSAYGNGWRQLWKYFLELFLILIIVFIISIPTNIGGWAGCAAGAVLSVIAIFYGLLILGPVNYGMNFAYLTAARGDKLEIKDMFAAFHNYWNAVLAS